MGSLVIELDDDEVLDRLDPALGGPDACESGWGTS